jgi:hypothetical protein
MDGLSENPRPSGERVPTKSAGEGVVPQVGWRPRRLALLAAPSPSHRFAAGPSLSPLGRGACADSIAPLEAEAL